MSLCPCKSGKNYAECCGAFHLKEKLPKTPLELMRSRYSAYVLGLVEYLIQTDTHSTQEDRSDIEAFAKGVEWIGLEIVDFDTTSVTFKAYYNANGKTQILCEKSEFIRQNGVWKYDKGEMSSGKIERNIACPCGSGKKFKRCCLL